MRDVRKLRAFELTDDLVVKVYHATRAFPDDERFGLTSQLRRASVSAASSIVEGAARTSEADFRRFLDIAYGSIREVEYQLRLSMRLGYLSPESASELVSHAVEAGRVLHGLISSLRKT